MAERFDAVILGAGPGGETVADRLLEAGRTVALVERELLGGECAYWACIPSKTLLRPPEVRSDSLRAQGIGEAAQLDWADTAAYRDMIIRGLDDAGPASAYQEKGATIVRGAGRLAGPGRVEVDGRVLETDAVVVATGSDPVVPPIDGLDEVEVWTNREVTTLQEIPDRAVFVGGGPVGIEMSQFLRRFGCQVTLVHHGDRLIDREDPAVGEMIGRVLADEGIDVRTGRRAVRARRADDGGAVLELDDGSEVAGDVVVAATGRSPRVTDLGLETVGVEPGKRGLAVDDRLRVTDGVWAIGDATGVLPFTHVAMYQGKVVGENLLGGDRRAEYRGIPRVVFSDPEIAAAGLTAAQAADAGIDAATAEIDLAQAIARPVTYEKEPRGRLGLVADRRRRVLVGAWIVAPLAGEWIHMPSTAIRAEVPLDVLRDGIAQFPTFSEGFFKGLEALEL